MSIRFPIRHSILSLAMISLIGCSTINDSNYAQLAAQSSEHIENILLNDLIKPFDQQGPVETSSLLLADVVDVPELNEVGGRVVTVSRKAEELGKSTRQRKADKSSPGFSL